MGTESTDQGTSEDERESSWLEPCGADADDHLPKTGPPLRRGSQIGDDFEVVEKLGQGGMGEVYRVKHLKLHGERALKFPLRSSDDASQHQNRQFTLAATCHERIGPHQNIVTIHDLKEVEIGETTWPCLVMEYVEGQSLAQRLRSGGVMGPRRAAEVMLQVLRGLAHAHDKGIWHRDLKPDNVQLGRDGQVKVLDLGLAQVDPDWKSAVRQVFGSGSEPAARAGAGGGTPAYAAPERWAGEQPDQRADIWAAGVTLFEMLTCTLPFTKETLQSGEPAAPPSARVLQSTVPEALDAVIRKALSWDRGGRYANAGEMLAALEPLAARLPRRSVPPDPPYRGLKPFTEEAEGWFFGRDAVRDELRELLKANGVVCLQGAPSAGKSSLVQAGLLPDLRQERPGWDVLKMAPGEDPLGRLADKLAELRGAEPDPEALRAGPQQCAAVLAATARARQRHLLVFVDQLELLLSHCRGERASAFLDALAQIGDDDHGAVRVLVTLQSGFAYQLGRISRSFGDKSRAILLDKPGDDDLVTTLHGPAQLRGYMFEQGLAQHLVQAVRDERAPLPLLQIAAAELWEARDRSRRLLTHAALQELEDLPGILARHADETLDLHCSDPSDRRLACELLCGLVSDQKTRRTKDRDELFEHTIQSLSDKNQLSDEDKPRARDVLLKLEQRRLTSSPEPGKVQLAHESLISHWTTLRDWLSVPEELRRARQWLKDSTDAWERNPRYHWDETALREWDEAVEKYSEESELPLTEKEVRFLRASREVVREARLALQQEEQRQRAERRRRRRDVVMLVSTLVIALAGLWAYYRKSEESAQNLADAAVLTDEVLSSANEELASLVTFGSGAAEVRRRLMERAEGLLRRLTATGSGRAVLARAEVQRLIGGGDSAKARGALYRARQSYQTALTLAQRAVRGYPEDVGLRQALAATLERRGALEQTAGRLDVARRAFAFALRERRRLVARHDDQPTLQYELASTALRCAALALARGDRGTAQEVSVEAVALCKGLVELDPERSAYQRCWARAEELRGEWTLALGQADKSMGAYDEAIETREALLVKEPYDVHTRTALARAYQRLGAAAEQAQDRPRAREALLKAIDVAADLVRWDVNNGWYREHLARSCRCLEGIDPTVRVSPCITR